LADRSHGKYDASLSEMLDHGSAKIRTWRSIDSILVPLAILTLLGDVFVRRRYLGD
jgi:hypothetical protein